MKYLLSIIGATLLIFSAGCGEANMKTENGAKEDMEMQTTSYTNIPFKTITGDSASLNDYKGNVVLIVNVASKCGFTKQYEGLEKLYRNKKDKGFVVLGFPANNFANQEPGTNEEILDFCQTNFGVTFPMMAKISVVGEDMHPLYKYLTEDSNLPGEVKWNFNKFLLDRDGNLIARYESKVAPEDPQLIGKIDELLGS